MAEYTLEQMTALFQQAITEHWSGARLTAATQAALDSTEPE